MFDFSGLNDAVLGTFADQCGVLFHRAQPFYTDGIWDSRHFEVEGGEMGGSDLITSITVKACDVDPVKVDEEVTVRGVRYRIYDPRPDGQGMITLLLERV